MTKPDWLTALTAFLAALLLVPVPAIAAPDLVDICHYTTEAAPDGHEWRHIRVSSRSVAKHVDHGDVMAGESLPGTNHQLDGDCNLVDEVPPPLPEPSEPPEPAPPPPSSELIFAVAYSDTYASDGAYNPASDVLIAKLVDGPDEAGDGLPGPGDRIVAHMYPKTVDATDLGAFTVTEHTVSAFSFGTGYSCLVQTEAGFFSWSSGQGNFDQYQEWSPSASVTNLYDDRTTDSVEGDLIQITSTSPSLPSDDLTVSGSDPNDEVFVDVEADCLTGAS